MIDAAMVMLETIALPSWTEDAPLRRELERLRDEVRAYHIAAAYDLDKATKLGARVNDRVTRINAFRRDHRHGTKARRAWDKLRTPV